MKKYILQKPKIDRYENRECPQWFNDAKLGIFIHWGPYSVPGWAPVNRASGADLLEEVVRDGYDVDSVNLIEPILEAKVKGYLKKGRIGKFIKAIKAIQNNPYSEWYWNSMNIRKATKKYHKRVWGNRPYTDFGPEFDAASRRWKPGDWSSLFKKAGAKYVLLTSKHHDGYCLWPSGVKNPKQDGWCSSRDLVGDLKASLDEEDIRLAIYYSSGLDWSLKPGPVSTIDSLERSLVHDERGLEYFNSQLKELIDRYKLAVLWQDIGYSKQGDFNEVLDYYYENVPDGLINDRAQPALKTPALRHFDYTTTEYFVPQTIRETPWETCRGISGSFGYNRDDDESTSLSAEELARSFADIISKNGNLMLGLGPEADGTIPGHQCRVVEKFGEWIGRNSEAVYGSRPYIRHDDVTQGGNDVRFTTKDGRLYAFIDGETGRSIRFRNLKIKGGASVKILGGGRTTAEPDGAVTLDEPSGSMGVVLQFGMDDVSL